MSAIAEQLGTVTGPLFAAEDKARSTFARQFRMEPFQFHHSLDRLPIFQLPALMALAGRLAARNDQKSHFESGWPDMNAYFGQRPDGTTMLEALEGIQTGQNWIILKRIHEDSLYGDALQSLIPELSELTGVDMAREFYDPTLTVFVTSPGRITPYHIDGETNFLAQIHGTKMVYVYDGNDPNILSPEMLERYWTGALPKLDYPENLPEGNWRWQLRPGTGIHNPVIFPHWLQNGPEVSVSVSINFKQKRDAVIGAHRTNRYVRKLGLTPTAPGKLPTVDKVKAATFGAAYDAALKVRSTLRKGRKA